MGKCALNYPFGISGYVVQPFGRMSLASQRRPLDNQCVDPFAGGVERQSTLLGRRRR